MILGVLSDPSVAVVNVSSNEILVDRLRHDHDPFGEEFGAESVVGAGVSEVDDQLEGFVGEGLQSEQDVVDQEIPVDVPSFVSGNWENNFG